MGKEKVLLVGPDQEENLSLRYLAAALVAAGHDVVIAPFNRARDRVSVVAAAERTTLVGLSLCFQVRAPEFLALARELKARAPGRRIVAGGHYASCAAEELLTHHPEIDLVVVHEGEQALVEIADAVRRGDDRWRAIRGLAFREEGRVVLSEPRPVLEDLDALPTPLRTGPARLLAGVPTAYLLGSRGCLGSCSYCCITTLHRKAPGKRFRQRDPERVAEEMGRLYHDRGVRQFIFHDDNFIVPSEAQNQRRLDALEAALERRGVRDFAFTIKCRPQDVQRPIFSRLREIGLIRVFLGVESGNAQGLACLGRQHSRAEAGAALELCRELGISAQYTMMIFHPDATLETCRADLAFMTEHIDHPLNFCRTEIYAGTPLEQRMIAEGRARGSYLGRSYAMADPRVQRVSDISTRLFLERCWATGGLFERCIGLDHLTAVMRHFYRGRKVERLAERVLAWRLAVNRDTLALLDRLFEVGPSGDAAALAELGQDERTSRRELFRRGLALFDELNDLTLAMIGLERRERTVAARSRPAGRLARHAAAALLAIGAASWTACDDRSTPPADAKVNLEIGQTEYAPPPVDGGPDAPTPVDGQVHLEIGQTEYAPPPVDGQVHLEIGQAEYAPPPVDAQSVKLEFGQAEYAPGPLDAGPGDEPDEP